MHSHLLSHALEFTEEEIAEIDKQHDACREIKRKSAKKQKQAGETYCYICYRVYSSPTYLNNHLRIKHSPEEQALQIELKNAEVIDVLDDE
jgi:hypothetical protein